MSNSEIEKAARRLGALNPHTTPPPAQPARAPAAPVGNPPAGTPASAPFNVRGEVERLAKSENGRDHVLARVAILNHTDAYIDSFKPADQTTIELAQTQYDAHIAKVKTNAKAAGEAELAKELGVASIAEAKRLLGVAPAAPAAPGVTK